jgi:flagellar biogenesis protein FliO
MAMLRFKLSNHTPWVPRQRIVLVHCENQRILIGVAPQGFAHLGQWTSDGKPPDASFIETLRAVEQPSE